MKSLVSHFDHQVVGGRRHETLRIPDTANSENENLTPERVLMHTTGI